MLNVHDNDDVMTLEVLDIAVGVDNTHTRK
jgi:hypothetical protein